MTSSSSNSRLLPGRIPPPGEDAAADAIRQRRGARGITPLDANLLHFPGGAAGYNELLGALRDKGRLEADLRELIMLRIAALNNAAYEWIQHEPIGRQAGLTTGQLYAIRDVDTALPGSSHPQTIFSPLLLAALHFTDALTLVSIPNSSSFSHPAKPPAATLEVCQAFKEQLRSWATTRVGEDAVDSLTDDLYAEATMLVGTYNLVSRFLIGTDVNHLGDSEVPWPVDRVSQLVELPSFPTPESKATHKIHMITLKHPQGDFPWLVLCNSLLTSTKMWGWVIPYLLERYNILLHDQRGHGLSTLPSAPPPPHTAEALGYGPDDSARLTTIPLLAWDVQNLLTSPQTKKIIDGNDNDNDDTELKPIHAIIGVSQGGACALAFGALYPYTGCATPRIRTTKAVVSCDTGPRTPAGNREAWKERVELVLGAAVLSQEEVAQEYGEKIGLKKLSDVTVPRWFPSGSPLTSSSKTSVEAMVEKTPVRGLVEGARALGGYDLLASSAGEENALDVRGRLALFDSEIERVLLLAGSLDGNGKVAQGLENLKNNWAQASEKTKVEFTKIEGAGHLPMVDRPEEWWDVVGKWLAVI